MIKIINLLYYDINKLKKNAVFKEIFAQISGSAFKFLYAVNSLMSARMKFFKDIYVAEENDIPYALIGVKVLSGEEIRAHITNFILVENSLNIAENLINSVVQKFSAKGVSTFFIHIDKNDNELKDLFLSKANFRVLSGETFFDIKREYGEYNPHNYIKKMAEKNILNSLDLYNFLLSPNFKFYFKKNFIEFRQNLFSKNNEKLNYIIQNPKTDEIYAYFTLTKNAENTWILEPYIMNRYASYILDIIEFANNILSKKFETYSLKLLLCKYLTSYDDVESVLKNSGFEVIKENLILSKDYLKRVKDQVEIKNSSIVFNDINPAY